MKFHRQIKRGRRNAEQGYILLTLLLIVAMMIIFAAVIAPSIAFDLKRDREAEMIHRGCQYSRAIRAYYRKFGRYPVKLEDLENTNNIRFLRKRYKDPENCKNGKCADFKLLHFGEVQMALSMGGGQIPGATPVSQMGQSATSGAFGQSSAFGGSTLGSSSSSFGSSSTSSFGQNQQTTFNSNGTDSSQPQVSPDGSTVSSSGTPGQPGANAGGSDSSSSASPQIIGGPIIGVASLSKDKTIREYNKKKVYKDWAFVYDPTLDQGFLITTPYQPTLQNFSAQNNLNGQNGQNQNGQNGTSGFGNSFGNSFGSGNGFGSSSFGNSGNQNSPSNGNSNGGFGQPSNPNPPQQQQ
jgi:type II secretory pathway pseudopilin PulG